MNTSPWTNRRSANRRGFTLVELLVVVGIVTLLISILLPALSTAREVAYSLKCASNLRQIGAAAMMYSNEFKNSTLPLAIYADGYNSASTTSDKSDAWFVVLVAMKYLPVSFELPFTTQTPPKPINSAVVDYGSVFACPSAPDQAAISPRAHYTSSPAYLDGFYLGHYLAQPSYVVNPVVGGQANPVVCCSYGMNATNGNIRAHAADESSPATLVTTLGPEPCSACGNLFVSPRKLNQLGSLSELAFIFDGTGFNIATNFASRIMNRHGKGKSDTYVNAQSTGTTNVLFFDGHVETLPRHQLPWFVNATVENDFPTPGSLSLYELDAQQGGFSSPHWRADQ